MSIFKTNSRFSGLIEESSNNINKKQEYKKEKQQDCGDKPKIESQNSFKNDNNGFNRRNDFNSRDNNRRFYDNSEFEKKLKEREEKQKEEEKQKALDICNFPQLIKISVPIIEENTTKFLEKLKKKKKVDISIKEKIEPGWTELRKDKKTNQTIMNFNPTKVKNEYIKKPQDLAYDVLNHLEYLHQERNSRYIESWGYDEWEKMFIFPNYDYYYFDKLDEKYLENNPESDEEYENDNYEEDEY
jgi:hypothetical protein